MSDEASAWGRFLVGNYRQFRRQGARLVIAALGLALIAAALAAFFRPSVPLDYSKLGIHLLLDDGRERWPVELWSQHLDYAAALVGQGGYVVQVVRADDMEVERWQAFMDACAERGLRPILRLATVYEREGGYWRAPSPDEAGGYRTVGEAYAAFISSLDWPTDEHLVILLNEPNRGDEWGGRPNPSAYTRFVMDVAAILRQHDPNVRILNGALDLYAPHSGNQPLEDGFYYMSADAFMDAMFATEARVFLEFDYWNSHPYPMGAFRLPPWRQGYHFDYLNDAVASSPQPPSDIHNRGINGYEWELWMLSRYGITPPAVMITETGWRHGYDTVSPSSDKDGDYPSAELAAIYFDLAYRGNRADYPDLEGPSWVNWTPWLRDERVRMVAAFALNGAPSEWGHSNWLQLDDEGAVVGTTPMYDLVRQYPKE